MQTRAYENRLVRIENPQPLLADHPEFIEPMRETVRYEAPRLVDDEGADIDVRAWRFSYNARAVIEMPNRLRAKETAVIMVHPWAVDDEWGWQTPEPNGVVDFCTPEKNALAYKLQSLAISAGIAAVAGWFLAIDLATVHPTDYEPLVTFFAYSVLILGGLANYWGVIAGSVVLWALLEGSRVLKLFSDDADTAALRFGIVGLTLILLMAFRPQGMFGKKEEMVLGE